MQVAILTTPITVGDYRELFASTSFPAGGPSAAFLAANNAKKVNLFKAHDRLTQKLVSCDAYDDGEFVSLVQVVEMTAEEVQAAKDSAMAQIRGQRDRLLAACDWTQLADSTADKTAWATYRQALRDLPAVVADARTFSDWPRDPNWVEPAQL
jgi:Phage tail assembly chaperone protein